MAWSRHGTLVAATAATVTLPDTNLSVEVRNRGTGTIYARADGTTAVAAANNTFAVPAGQAVRVPDADVTSTTLSLISAAADAYSVTVVE